MDADAPSNTGNTPAPDQPTREDALAAKVVALSVVIRRAKARVEALKDGDPLDEILLGLGNGLALFGASNLAMERYEKEFSRGE